MNKPYKSKQALREEFEKLTDPERPLQAQAEAIAMSAMFGGLIGVRNGLKILKENYTDSNQDFPSEAHKEITHRVMAGMGERITAFELELINVLVDLAWEVHECQCEHCVEMDAQMQAQARAANARNN